MSASLTRVTIQVPGSTSNLGPGFDCLGIARRIVAADHAGTRCLATA